MIVVATDAPLDARDLERLAARAIFALARDQGRAPRRGRCDTETAR
jgi:L-aminopeptidase/D-esterase-like protein